MVIVELSILAEDPASQCCACFFLHSEMCVDLKSECGCGSNAAHVVTNPLPRLHSNIKSKAQLPPTESNSNFASKSDIATDGTKKILLPNTFAETSSIFLYQILIRIFAVLTVRRSPRSLGMRREDGTRENCKYGSCRQKSDFCILLKFRFLLLLICFLISFI